MSGFRTPLTDLLGIEVPILQSGMRGVAGPELVRNLIEEAWAAMARLHTAFAWFTAVCLYSVSLKAGMGAGLVALAVAWSRLELRRHTPAEVAVGILLGVTIGTMLLFWPV